MDEHNVNTDMPKTVTLESLLRLKKAERPDEQFWQDFEARFEQKRWQALQRTADVEVAAHGHRRLFSLLRLGSVGAMAACLAVGLMSLRIVPNPVVSADAQAPAATAVSAQPVIAASQASPAELTPLPGDYSLSIAGSNVSGQSADYVIDVLNLASASPVRSFERVMEPQTFRASGNSYAIYVADSLSASREEAVNATYDFF